MDIEDIIEECVNIELEEGLHFDKIDNYSSPSEFYLSNIVGDKKEQYIEHLIDYYDLSNEDAKYVYKEVVNLIKSEYE